METPTLSSNRNSKDLPVKLHKFGSCFGARWEMSLKEGGEKATENTLNCINCMTSVRSRFLALVPPRTCVTPSDTFPFLDL